MSIFHNATTIYVTISCHFENKVNSYVSNVHWSSGTERWRLVDCAEDVNGDFYNKEETFLPKYKDF